jgi:hypothetical protein
MDWPTFTNKLLLVENFLEAPMVLEHSQRFWAVKKEKISERLPIFFGNFCI